MGPQTLKIVIFFWFCLHERISFWGKILPEILERYFIGLFINENLTKLEKKVGTEKIDVILFLFISLSVMKGQMDCWKYTLEH